MADYGIVIKIDKIKGSSKLPDFKECLLAQEVRFSSTSTREGKWTTTPDKDRRISVTQTPVTAKILAGTWVALLQEALFKKQVLGDVTITQLGQAVDKNATAKPTVLQKITLKDAVVTRVEQSWSAGDDARIVEIKFEFTNILLEIEKKKADFTLRNSTAKAV